MKKTIILAVGLLLGAHANAENPSGYFVKIFNSQGANSQKGVVGNLADKHVADLNCESGFQSENIFTVTCTSSSTAPFDKKGYVFLINNLFSINPGGRLYVKGDRLLTS